MGLETRKGGGTYYYRKIWQNGRCRSVYMGSGDLAQALAAMDAEDRAASKKDDRPDDSAAAALVAQVEAYCDEVTQVMRAHLEASGYRRHKRGEWRKTRKR